MIVVSLCPTASQRQQQNPAQLLKDAHQSFNVFNIPRPLALVLSRCCKLVSTDLQGSIALHLGSSDSFISIIVYSFLIQEALIVMFLHTWSSS